MISNEARKYLQASAISELDPRYIFAYRIDPDIDTENKITILFRDITNRPDDFGSNRFNSFYQQIGMQIFYPVDYADDTEKIELKILRELEKHGYEAVYSTGTKSEPETNRLYSTYNLSRNKSLQD